MNDPELEVDVRGNRRWYRSRVGGPRRLHRDGAPAVELINGDRFWYDNGELHRVDGPAVELANGTQYWYRRNRYHRDGGPVIVRPAERLEHDDNG